MVSRFWRWFYSYEGIPLQLNKKRRVAGFIFVVLSFLLAIGVAVSIFVLDNELLMCHFILGVLFCVGFNLMFIANDLSRQLKKAVKKEWNG